ILSVSIVIIISVLGRPSLFQNGWRHSRAMNAHHSATALRTSSSQIISPVEAEARAGINERYGRLPMRFEANPAHTDHTVKFITRGDAYSLFLTAKEAVWRWQRARRESGAVGAGEEGNPKSEIRNPEPKVRNSKLETRNVTPALLRMRLVGANPEPPVTG